jgi:predicted nucleic acid-binding protein
VLLCDTGVLLAAGNVKDHAHKACLRLLRHAEGPLLVPSPVLGEIATLDHRHFTVIRPRHVQAFTLLPGPGHALS